MCPESPKFSNALRAFDMDYAPAVSVEVPRSGPRRQKAARWHTANSHNDFPYWHVWGFLLFLGIPPLIMKRDLALSQSLNKSHISVWKTSAARSAQPARRRTVHPHARSMEVASFRSGMVQSAMLKEHGWLLCSLSSTWHPAGQMGQQPPRVSHRSEDGETERYTNDPNVGKRQL